MWLLRNRLLAGLALAFGVLPAHAAEPVYTGWFGNVAAGGHDVVAYFTEGRPVKGSADHSLEWRGAEWRFASAEHRDLFRREPERYAPAYGGYCAYAVAQGSTAAGRPQHWAIHDGRLYLNYSRGIQERWDADRPGFIAAADQNWPEVAD